MENLNKSMRLAQRAAHHPPKEGWVSLKSGFVKIYRTWHNLGWLRHGSNHIDLQDVVDIETVGKQYPKNHWVVKLSIRGIEKPLITAMRKSEIASLIKAWMGAHRK